MHVYLSLTCFCVYQGLKNQQFTQNNHTALMSQVHAANLNVPDGSVAAVQCVRELDSSAAPGINTDKNGLSCASASESVEGQVAAE